MNINIFIVFVIGACAAYSVNAKVVICYYGTWATYRSGLGKFDVDHINPDLCTHLIYTFVGITSTGTVVSLDPNLDFADNWGRDNFRKFTALKKRNPNLKTLLAVGGWNEGSAKYSVMAANASYRKNFIQSALAMVLNHGFDGFDLDWEYPARRDSVYGSADVDNFTKLIRELREVFDEYGLLLTAAVSSVESTASLSYDIPEISRHLDFINVMTYDMYGAWDAVTGHNAPLHAGEGDESANKNSLFTVDVALDYWLRAGCPPEKLILGVPFYGRTFTLRSASVNSVRAPAVGAGIAGAYTATSGFVGYNEFCYMLQTEKWTVRRDELAKVPYAYRDRNWVSYDDPESITAKVEYAMSLNLGGVMMWSIETDDFNGVCGEGDFPLLRAINKALKSSGSSTGVTEPTYTTEKESPSEPPTEPPTIPTSEPTTGPTTEPTAQASTTETLSTTIKPSTTAPDSSICKESGYAPNPEDCSSFYMCTSDVDGSLKPVKFYCPSKTYWDQSYLYCNYQELVECSI